MNNAQLLITVPMHPTYEDLSDSFEATVLLGRLQAKHLEFLATTKACRTCHQEKPRSDFPQHSHGYDGRDSRCRDCKNEAARLRKALRQQHECPPPGECPLCHRHTTKWVIDHCHHSKQARGYICDSCNTALGGFRDDPDIIRRALAWVEEPKTLPRTDLPRHLL